MIRMVGVFAALMVANSALAAQWSTPGGCDVEANVGRDDVVQLFANGLEMSKWQPAEIIGHEWGCSVHVTGETATGYSAVGVCYFEDQQETLQLEIQRVDNAVHVSVQGELGNTVEFTDRCG